MSYLLAFPILALLALLQTSFLPPLLPLSQGPNLVFLGLLSWALEAREGPGLFWALVGSVLLGVLGGVPLGLYLLLFALLVPLAAATRRWLVLPTLPALLLLGFLASIFAEAPVLAVMEALGRPIDWPGHTTLVLVPQAVFNALAMPLVYWPLRWLAVRMGAQTIQVVA